MLALVVSQQAQAQTRRRTTTKYAKFVKKEIKMRKSGKPYTGYHKQPPGKAVDLGLSVLWADRNVGAASPTDEGGAFLWGSVTGMLGRMAEYEKKPDIPLIILSQYDTANRCWGASWRMPSVDDFIELFTKCKMTAVKDAEGFYSLLKLTGPNGNSIIMPMTGRVRVDDDPNRLYRYSLTGGYYWIGEENRDSVGWGNGKFYKMSILSGLKQPYLAAIESAGWNSYFVPTLKNVSVYSTTDWERNLYGNAVRPVMDKDIFASNGNTVKRSSTVKKNVVGRESSEKTVSQKKPQGTKSTSFYWKNTRKKTSQPPTGTKREQDTRNGGEPANSSPNSVGGTHTTTQTKRPHQVGKNNNAIPSESSTQTNQTNRTNQKNPPIPTPKPKRINPNPTPEKNEPIVVERAVDLGLSVYWSDRNLGAKSISDPGEYFCWGLPEPKELKAQEIEEKFPKILDISGTEYDIASARWGARWRMPTKSELEELIQNCTFQLTTIHEQKGLKVTGKNGNWIFLPFGGSYSTLSGECYLDDCVRIWSATKTKNNSVSAFTGYFTPRKTKVEHLVETWLCNVRPVTKRLLHPKMEHPMH